MSSVDADKDDVLTEAQVTAVMAAPTPTDPIEAIAMMANAARLLGWNIAVRVDPPDDPQGKVVAFIAGEPDWIKLVNFEATR